MPIEDIQVKKAPPGWRMTSDQAQQIERDPRLQRLSKDELYFYFNQPKRPAQRAAGNQSRPAREESSSGLFGWIDQITNALRGR